MKRVLILLVMLGAPLFAQSETSRWTVAVKGGLMQPAEQSWADYYGDEELPLFNVNAGYRVAPWLELGGSFDYLSDSGQGRFPSDGSLGGSVLYESYPVGLYAMLRLQFSDRQWLVPYAAAAFERLYYTQSIRDQGRSRGSVDGSAIRAGLQIMLDRLDKTETGFKDFGARHVYLVLEYMTRDAVENSTNADLGGEAYSTGILFEF